MTQKTRKNKKRYYRHLPSWKDYFTFSTRVRRGLMVLFIFIGIEIWLLLYLNYNPQTAVAVDVEKFRQEIDAFYASADTAVADHPDSVTSSVDPELFAFNPNRLPDEAWRRLGFSDKQIRSIRNFESKGGKFRSKEDVKKMYAISDAEYSRIEPYITIPESRQASPYKKQKLLVDVGTADSTLLEKLPMVGMWLAVKICRFRESLGGFYSVEQLKEVHGMRDSTFEVIRPFITLKDSLNLRKINLNTASFEELSKHPYITHALANILINYRKQHGGFSAPQEIQQITLVNAELYRKIAPYLKAE